MPLGPDNPPPLKRSTEWENTFDDDDDDDDHVVWATTQCVGRKIEQVSSLLATVTGYGGRCPRAFGM